MLLTSSFDEGKSSVHMGFLCDKVLGETAMYCALVNYFDLGFGVRAELVNSLRLIVSRYWPLRQMVIDIPIPDAQLGQYTPFTLPNFQFEIGRIRVIVSYSQKLPYEGEAEDEETVLLSITVMRGQKSMTFWLRKDAKDESGYTINEKPPDRESLTIATHVGLR
jgi:hypothetical protein